MCIRLKTVSAETLRIHLLDQYGVGLIALGESNLRVAFSCMEEADVEKLFDTIFQGVKIWKKVSRSCRITETKQSPYQRNSMQKLKSLNIAQATRWSFYFIAIGLIAGSVPSFSLPVPVGCSLFFWTCSPVTAPRRRPVNTTCCRPHRFPSTA
jgi:hypothetical protein